MVSAKQISFGYHEDNMLFEHISFKISRGDRLAIVGENGAGKSTLMRMIAGAVEPTEGALHYDNGVRMCYVLQEFDGVDESVRDYILRHTRNIGKAIEYTAAL